MAVVTHAVRGAHGIQPARATHPGPAPSLADHCVICGTSLEGPLAYLFRAAGIGRSARNPNLCSRCNTHAEEGRVVELTVLFADLTSFTELTHELGPQRTHQVVDAFLQMATNDIVLHDGFIDKYVGDAVMAFFNVPIHRDDHAARGAEAAMAIQAGVAVLGARFGLALRARVGIASGWAHLGRLGSRDRRDYTAIGDVVNLAARLEAQASPGEIVVGERSYAGIAGRFPALRPEWLSVKGFHEPVEAYRLGAQFGPAASAAEAAFGDGVERPATDGTAPMPLPDGTAGPSRAHLRRTEKAWRGWLMQTGAVLFAILGAPCAAAAVFGPLAVGMGLTALFGASSALWLLDNPWLRLPLLFVASGGAVANLLTAWHARHVRQEARLHGGGGECLVPTPRERRRTRLVLGTSVVTLLIAAYEVYAHAAVFQHPLP
ncbi:MAG: adenylate/guanylate cyclase domain-containing protein [Chloroflexi bacterium]|nr:adenylate/guanylate cyclase domain-containing protein [Chloroflexota bacterium]